MVYPDDPHARKTWLEQTREALRQGHIKNVMAACRAVEVRAPEPVRNGPKRV